MKHNRVNVLTVVNSASNITTETIDSKPHIVVRGITPVVDDICALSAFLTSSLAWSNIGVSVGPELRVRLCAEINNRWGNERILKHVAVPQGHNARAGRDRA